MQKHETRLFPNDREDASWAIPFQDLAGFTEIAVIQAAKHCRTVTLTHSQPSPQGPSVGLASCLLHHALK